MSSENQTQKFPSVSIVVPAFRAVRTIRRTLDSLVAQDWPDLRIIVMDGGSDDGTVDVIREYEDRLAYWTSAKDECQADALNKGFERADGELLGWLCADDVLAPGAVSRLAGFLRDNPEIDVVTGGCRRDFNGKSVVDTEPSEDFFERLDYVNTIEQPSTLWRRTAHERAGPLDLTYRYAFDWEFWCRLKRTGARFARIPDPVSIYYFSDDNLTSSGGTKIADEMYRVIREYGPYDGRLADVYRFLYRTFDLRGFYDQGATEKMPEWKRRVFYSILKVMYRIYGKDLVDSYNWNFASRQERGLGWESQGDESAKATVDEKLIFDLGMHIGQDTEFYLKKGFRVVAVEANPVLVADAEKKFRNQIADGRLTIVNRGISDKKGSFPFYVNETHSSWSSFDEAIGSRGGKYHVIEVETVTMAELFAHHGTPYFVKIDIEGFDHIALFGIGELAEKPKYISVENGFPQLLNLLSSYGYTSFKFVNQADVGTQELPKPPLEGRYARHQFEIGSSGAFGEEAPGRWIAKEEALEHINAYWNIPNRTAEEHGWYDLHARRDIVRVDQPSTMGVNPSGRGDSPQSNLSLGAAEADKPADLLGDEVQACAGKSMTNAGFERTELVEFDREALFEHRRPPSADTLIHISLPNKYVYFEVAKAACTTIKFHLQKLEFLGTEYVRPKRPHEVHDRWKAPFLMPVQLDDSTLSRALKGDEFFRFTFVRNPYARILSAYLDKIERNAPQKAPILEALDRDASDLSQKVEFSEFLRALKNIPLREMDIHFIPQWVSNFAGKVDFGFIGAMELFESDFRSVYARIAPSWFSNQLVLEKEGGHQTEAAEQISKYFGAEEQSMALDLYGRDFEWFNYSTDIADASNPPVGRALPVAEEHSVDRGVPGLTPVESAPSD